jgi:MFS transporter, UMF1 family
MVITGVWWIACLYLPWRRLHPRPGPPLPRGRSIISVSLASIRETLSQLWTLRQTLLFLVLWALYSDAAWSVGNLGGLFANSEITWPCAFPKALGVLAMFFASPVFGVLGNMGALRLQARFNLSSRALLTASVLVIALVPCWGLLGFVSPTYGLRQGWEAVAVACIYGVGECRMAGGGVEASPPPTLAAA